MVMLGVVTVSNFLSSTSGFTQRREGSKGAKVKMLTGILMLRVCVKYRSAGELNLTG
jgi:hypothetical protein